VNLPFVHSDETGKFDPAAIRKDILDPELDNHGEPRHLLAAMKLSLKVLAAQDAPDQDKAVHLCWILHLIGDVHQPLHASALIGSKAKFDPEQFDPPHGDQGANRCAIKINATDQNAIELHFFWDALQFEDEPKFPIVESKVLEWLKDPLLQREKFPELAASAFLTWADESLELAKTSAYKEGSSLLKFRPLAAKHTKLDLEKLDAPPLSPTYKSNAAEVAKKRMVLAGHRLADQLKAALKNP
jgi:hypothetical protein